MKWVVGAFVGFALFIGTLVFICVRQDVNLVSVNYYQEELVHQQKIDQQQNMVELKEQPVIVLENEQVKLTFAGLNKLTKGELRLTRPSDEKLDQRFKLNQGEQQNFRLIKSEKGLYRVTMQWTMNGKDYYYEKLMVL
ncbi:MAG: FixH family protein [Cyclobacteriaceae bacterium]